MKGQDLGQGQGHLHLLFEGIIIKAHNLLEAHVLLVEIKNILPDSVLKGQTVII